MVSRRIVFKLISLLDFIFLGYPAQYAAAQIKSALGYPYYQGYNYATPYYSSRKYCYVFVF